MKILWRNWWKGLLRNNLKYVNHEGSEAAPKTGRQTPPAQGQRDLEKQFDFKKEWKRVAEDCGLENPDLPDFKDRSARIVGGFEAKSNQWP